MRSHVFSETDKGVMYFWGSAKILILTMKIQATVSSSIPLHTPPHLLEWDVQWNPTILLRLVLNF